MKTANTVAEAVAASETALVEIAGESREARFTRINKALTALEYAQAGFSSWDAEHKTLAAQYRRVFRFRAFGAK